MRILHVSSKSTLSGANRYAFDLSAGQIDLGHAPIVAMPGDPGSAFEFGRPDIECIKLGAPRALSFLAVARRVKPDLLHVHDGTVARWTRFMPFRPPSLASLHISYKPASMDHFEGVHVVAEWQMAALAGFKGKVARISNWTPALVPADASDAARARQAAGAAPADFLIVYVGRLEEVKGVHHLIAAVRSLPDPKLKLAIIGAGPVEPDLRAKAEGEPRIIFMGQSSQPAAWYGAADLVVVPSRREPFGLVAIEAMSCNAPVLASNVDGLAEIFNDRPDCLTPPENPAELAARIAARAAARSGPGPGPQRDAYDMSRFDRLSGIAAVTRFCEDIVARA